MELDPSEHADSMHRILTSIVTPRPIGWISTRNDDRDNLAPYSYFNAVSTYPPVVMFSGSRRDGDRKDSSRMAVESGEFVANLVTEDLVEEMDATSAPLAGASEFDFAGLERDESEVVDAPRVAEAAAHMECSVYDTVEIYDNLLVFGEVVHIAVDERLTTDGVIDMNRIDSVGRLGGPYYTGLRFLDVERSNFGPWSGPTPAGFTVDEETRTVTVDREEYEAIREALVRLDQGEQLEEVVAESRFDEETLANCFDRRSLYLEARADDERLEAALVEAGYDAQYSY